MCAAEILRLVRRTWENHWGGGQAVARVSGYLVSAGKLVLGRNQTSAFVGGRGLDSCGSRHKSLICTLKRSGNG